jgi:hypothetical protein
LAGILVGVALVGLTITPARVIKAESAAQAVSMMELPGAASDVNNIALAFNGAYSVVAQFEASDPENQDPFFGDNHYVVVTDLSNPSRTFPLDLSSIGAGAQTCYYPSHLIVSSNNIAFVRATAVNAVTHKPAGEAIAYGQLILDKQTGNPEFEGAVIVAPISKDVLVSVPNGFGVSKSGQYLVFTDGAQMISYNIPTGDTYAVKLLAGQYRPLPDPATDPNAATSDYETITSLNVDSNNVVSVVVNGRTNGADFSRIFFYRLLEGARSKHSPGIPGTFNGLAPTIDSAEFGGGQIAPYSQAAVSPDGLRGYFATTEGSVWAVDLNDAPTLSLSRLGSFACLVGDAGYLAGPRNVAIDASGSSLSVVKQGATINIRRPAYGRHGGGIRRPAYSKYADSPALVLLYLNGNGSVADSVPIPSQGFGNGPYAISSPSFTPDRGAYVAVSYYSSPGTLMLFDKTGHRTDSGLALPNNIGQIVSAGGLAGGPALLGLRDFDVKADVPDSKTSSLVFMGLQQGSYDITVSSSKAAIRRPCNVNH